MGRRCSYGVEDGETAIASRPSVPANGAVPTAGDGRAVAVAPGYLAIEPTSRSQRSSSRLRSAELPYLAKS